MTMVTTFSLLFMNFGLNGFTEAVIQRERSTTGWPATCSGRTWVSRRLTAVFAAVDP